MTGSYSALSPVSVGIYAALNVAALLALVPGGVDSVVPPITARPYLAFVLSKEREYGGFGTYAGHGDMAGLLLSLSAITDQENVSQGQAIIAMALSLLYQPGAIVVAGYTVCGRMPLPGDLNPVSGDTLIANVVVHEEVATIQLIVENISA
jgi:hypothetical protein